MITVYEKKGRIAYVTLNRPEVLNAMNVQVKRELAEIWVDFRDDPEVWVGVVSGVGGKAFSAGSDIKEPLRKREFEPLQMGGIDIWKPLIAAIDGWCVGGGLELAMECDIRIAAEHAQMGQPEINIGFMPGAGGTIRLPRFIPRAIAAEMLLTGSRLNAQEALHYGLVSKVVPLDQLMPTAKEIANTICTRGPLGVRSSKEAIIKGYEMDLEEALKLERKLNAQLRTTEDFMEGARAFAEKRTPQYKGK